MNQTKVQYWKNGIMLTLVTPEEAKAIMAGARNAGLKVYDNGSYFSVEKD